MTYSVAQTVVWNSCNHREYLLIYSFKLESGFALCQLFSVLWLKFGDAIA